MFIQIGQVNSHSIFLNTSWAVLVTSSALVWLQEERPADLLLALLKIFGKFP